MHEKLEAQARKKLEMMDPVRFGRDSKIPLAIRDDKKYDKEDDEIDEAAIIRGMQHHDINQTQPIVCSCLLLPYPLLVVCMKIPILIGIQL